MAILILNQPSYIAGYEVLWLMDNRRYRATIWVRSQRQATLWSKDWDVLRKRVYWWVFDQPSLPAKKDSWYAGASK